MTIEEAVRARIASLTAVTAIVGDRIWTDVIPESAVYPAVRVLEITDVDDQHLRGPEGVKRARVQVDAMIRDTGSADVYATLADLAAAIHGDGLGRSASGVFGWIGGVGSPPLRIQGVTASARVRRYDPDELQVLTFSRDYFLRYVA